MIKTSEQAITVAEHINNKLPVGGCVELGNHVITKTEDRTFDVAGPRVGLNPRYLVSELAYFIIWPERRTVNRQIVEARRATANQS